MTHRLDWFERLTGFPETSYAETCSRLAVEGEILHSRVNGRSFAIGQLEIVSLQTLRERVALTPSAPGRLSVRNISGDVRALHQLPAFSGALFQVASQFNLLEMVAPDVTPEHGVTRYQHDRTQGPACAIAAGAATIYRNYFVPLADQQGQTADRQLDCLAGIGAALSDALAQPVGHLWTMRNGYALCTATGIRTIGAHLGALDDSAIDTLRGLLQIGLHQDVAVTASDTHPPPRVSQAFCSALPVAYCDHPWPEWRPFATLVLEAAYEATMWAAVLNARRGASNIVLLTRLGGGAFGNDDTRIDAAMRRALGKARDFDLDVRLVSFGPPSAGMRETERMFA
jgi:hypothetical protein